MSRMRFSNAFYVRATLGGSLLVCGVMYFSMVQAQTPLLISTADIPYRNSTLGDEERITDLLSRMTLTEKIGQMALVERNSLEKPEHITQYGIGGLLSGSGSKPESNTAAGWLEMTQEYQRLANESRLGIPLLYGSDAIHGHAHVLGATVFPHAVALGATNNQQLVQKIGQATAAELVATGVNWNFGPNLDLPQDIRWGRMYEAFSSDPTMASGLGVAYLQGLQKRDTLGGVTTTGVLGTLKHYVGLGGMEWKSSTNPNFKIDQGVTPVNELALRSAYLPPFAAGIDAGALSVMVGLNTWDGRRVVVNKYLLTEVLKGEFGFSGFVVSDWYGVYEGRTSTFVATIEAINAGVDMVMLPFDYKTFVRNVTWAHRLGFISQDRIDDAVRRILRAKFAAGLFDDATVDSFAAFNTKSNRALAREAVAQSLVLLKNTDNILPLSPFTKQVLVAGSAADNVGQQSGAWTMEWQGIDGNWIPGATSILAGIKDSVSPGTRVEYAKDGLFQGDATADCVGLAVVGEKPYAEGWGDREYPALSADDVTAIKNLKARCAQVVVVVVAGRPLLIAHEIDMFDALVMAWLPGSEGGGVADVLFGYKSFRGTLPVSWTHHAEQLPMSVDEQTADGTSVLYPRGFGIVP